MSHKLFCTQCGKEIEIGSSFCPYCGAKVVESSRQGTQSAAPRNVIHNINFKSNKPLWLIIGVVLILGVIAFSRASSASNGFSTNTSFGEPKYKTAQKAFKQYTLSLDDSYTSLSSIPCDLMYNDDDNSYFFTLTGTPISDHPVQFLLAKASLGNDTYIYIMYVTGNNATLNALGGNRMNSTKRLIVVDNDSDIDIDDISDNFNLEQAGHDFNIENQP
ncbi:hypothetical protein IWT140_00078 [Secundilactobacillus pentosiphilus]|uniref:Zinc-ribbon domain-containing protein n=1 Tax=Secundilactobacillus pentosiphilus TaxID=1714682 RepID=A0A1Z5IM54_9LACO|nr:zinc ribbon domain-containing protein [Secundilactobacillus pentosiphilus]GAX02481.1 hypothetical protein IWT140_00078 [Secundilactobacillus pentosiphilus]